MTIEEAHRLAQEYLDGYFPPSDPVLLFPDEAAEDRGWCYVFYYNTKRYLETEDINYALGPGPGPVVVVKANSEVWMTGGGNPEGQLSAYAAEHGYS